MKFDLKRILLLLIVFAGFVFRFYQVKNYPSGFSADEFSQGYTAYSLLKTGKDEWGVKFPLAPRAFGDFRSPLYTYLIIPSIAVFGLNEFAVRLPNAILGTLAVVVVYFLVKELFRREFLRIDNRLPAKSVGIDTDLLPLFSAFFLAVSPWHISLSRGAFEANLTTFFLPLAIFLFLRGIQSSSPHSRNSLFIILASTVFGLNMFSYFAPRFFTPVCVVVLLTAFRKEFFKEKKKAVFFLLIFGFFMLLSFQTLLNGAKTRVADTSILNQGSNWGNLSSRQYEAVFLGIPQNLERLFNNKITYLSNLFIKNYFGYFSADFLFLKGASEWTYGMISGRGVLYLFEIPLIILALWQLPRTKEKKTRLILILLFLSPIAASLAKGERAANRASTMIPFIQILSGYGAVVFWEYLKGKSCQKIIQMFSVAIFLVFTAFFFEDYFYHAPMNTARYMAYGWREAGEYLKQNVGFNKKVVVNRNFSEPQIAVAYFLKIDPEIVQKNSLSWLDYQKKGFLFVDQMSEYSLENFEFRNFRFPEDRKLKDTLFVGREEDFFGIEGEVKKVVYFPGPEKKIAFKIVSFE